MRFWCYTSNLNWIAPNTCIYLSGTIVLLITMPSWSSLVLIFWDYSASISQIWYTCRADTMPWRWHQHFIWYQCTVRFCGCAIWCICAVICVMHSHTISALYLHLWLLQARIQLFPRWIKSLLASYSTAVFVANISGFVP